MMMRVITLILIASILAPLPVFAADSDARLVKRTRTEKRHYRKKHEDSNSSNSSSGENILLGLQLLGSVLELAAELDEEEEELEYDDQGYPLEGWEQDDEFIAEGFVRASSGLVFQQPFEGRAAYTGATMLLGVGLAVTPDDYASGVRLAVEGGLWIDDYTLVDAGALGLYGAIRAGGPWRVVQPYFGMSFGFLGQYGFEALGPSGSFLDFQTGLDVRVRAVSVGVVASAGFQLLPSENEDENSELTGFRQSLAVSTAYHF